MGVVFRFGLWDGVVDGVAEMREIVEVDIGVFGPALHSFPNRGSHTNEEDFDLVDLFVSAAAAIGSGAHVAGKVGRALVRKF